MPILHVYAYKHAALKIVCLLVPYQIMGCPGNTLIAANTGPVLMEIIQDRETSGTLAMKIPQSCTEL